MPPKKKKKIKLDSKQQTLFGLLGQDKHARPDVADHDATDQTSESEMTKDVSKSNTLSDNETTLTTGLGALLAVYLMIGYGAQFVCNFVGFLYPAYCSVKAIETAQKEDDTQWLMYWVVYSVFALSEMLTDIFFFWVPFYWFFKCCFLVWCMSSASWNGSDLIYNRVIRPFVLKHQKKIDDAIDQAADKLKDVQEIVQDETEEALTDIARRRIADTTKMD